VSSRAHAASFVTIVFVVVSVALASALFIWLDVFAEKIAKRPFVGWLTFVVVLTLVTAGVLLACPRVYSAIHADIVWEWH
jgi:hypothetical protein